MNGFKPGVPPAIDLPILPFRAIQLNSGTVAYAFVGLSIFFHWASRHQTQIGPAA
jgi:hypothetical protein